jgi:hypothetical protein
MQTGVWIYRVVVALSGITLILVIVYLVVGEQNRTVQTKINERQQFINQSLEFARINQALVRAMATVAFNDKDDKLRALLAQNGITINPKTGAPAAASGTGANPDLAPAEKQP